ncbi:MAG: arylesterase [Candidatus Parabeggiatoa sp. nov. 3]|nr:MAG: arylesterase [Gammaproteobacteria bacterium]RKZ82228.1 MAG: arylesterase [Gammaproteobacteria bacterium]HEW98199.1 arylesterase [Beggiatoa sp.]
MIIGYLCSCSDNASIDEAHQANNVRETERVIKSQLKTGIPLLVIGDSLSAAYGIQPEQGWVHLLGQRLATQGYQVINASISGDTTSNGLRRLRKALLRYRPEIVVIELGANDGLRGLNLKAMENNLAGMIKAAQEIGANVLLLGMRIPPNYGKAYTQGFHQIYHDLAARYQIPLVAFFLEGVALNRALMQSDELHPKAVAQPQILENVWSKLGGMLEK